MSFILFLCWFFTVQHFVHTPLLPILYMWNKFVSHNTLKIPPSFQPPRLSLIIYIFYFSTDLYYGSMIFKPSICGTTQSSTSISKLEMLLFLVKLYFICYVSCFFSDVSHTLLRLVSNLPFDSSLDSPRRTISSIKNASRIDSWMCFVSIFKSKLKNKGLKLIIGW